MNNELKMTAALGGLFLLVSLIAFAQSGDGKVRMGLSESTGAPAPELELSDCLNSEKLATFNNYVGEYILLDFWGTH